MTYTGKEAVFQLATILKKKGVETAVLSPGSRNAPLIAALNRQEGIRCLSIVDERSAAFFALGIAQQTGKPVAIACTSGTAALNYAPAIAEAYYQQLPLIVITADRPPEWIDQGDGQAIRQVGMYANFTRKSINLPLEPKNETDLRYHARLIHEAIDASCYPVCGPVHLNIPLREPLYQNLKPEAVPDVWHEYFTIKARADLLELQSLVKQWNAASSKLVVVGQLSPCPQINHLLNALAEDPSVAIFTETTSNLHGSRFFPHIDRLVDGLRVVNSKNIVPEILLSLGGNLISRKIKSWLQNNPPRTHWHVAPDAIHLDPYRALSLTIPMQALNFLEDFQPLVQPKESDYYSHWKELHDIRTHRHHDFLQQCPWSDLKAFEAILAQVPPTFVIHAANSTPIRYLQLFDQAPGTLCFANRGTSGIDGCMSTAAGAAWANPAPAVLISGDLAFLYDSNALWNKHITPNLRIIVINNGGGNIFRIIEGPDTLPELETFIETPYIPQLHHLASMYGLDYSMVDNELSLREELIHFMNVASEKAAILEIKTPNKISAKVLRDYFKYLSS